MVNQTWPNIELVLVDAIGQGLLSPVSAHPGLVTDIISTGRQMDRPTAANAGLDHAHGDWLLFLDDDDWLAPEHIQALMTGLQGKPELLAYSNTNVTDHSGHATGKVFAQAFDPVLLLRDNYIPIHSALFSRTLLDKGCRFDETLSIYEDWDFWLQCSRHSDFIHVNADTAFYRQGGDSATALEQEQERDKYHNSTPQARARIAVLGKWLPHWRAEDLNTLLVSSADFNSIKSELAACIGHNQNLEQENRKIADLLHQSRVEQQAADTRHHQTVIQLQDLQNRFDHLEAQHTQLDNQLAYVRQSLSWRSTRPLRWIGRHLKRTGGRRTHD